MNKCVWLLLIPQLLCACTSQLYLPPTIPEFASAVDEEPGKIEHFPAYCEYAISNMPEAIFNHCLYAHTDQTLYNIHPEKSSYKIWWWEKEGSEQKNNLKTALIVKLPFKDIDSIAFVDPQQLQIYRTGEADKTVVAINSPAVKKLADHLFSHGVFKSDSPRPYLSHWYPPNLDNRSTYLDSNYNWGSLQNQKNTSTVILDTTPPQPSYIEQNLPDLHQEIMDQIMTPNQ